VEGLARCPFGKPRADHLLPHIPPARPSALAVCCPYTESQSSNSPIYTEARLCVLLPGTALNTSRTGTPAWAFL